VLSRETSAQWGAVFDGVFRDVADTVQRRVWRAVYGEEYPEGVEPYSFVSNTELRRFADELRVGSDDVLGDLGCGLGGPGRWMAVRTGARLVGIDVSTVAVDTARRQAAALGLAGRTEYRHGSFEENDLADGELDAVMSIDALLFAVDKPTALAGLARVLRPGGRLVTTTFDYHRQPQGRPPQVDDHRPLLKRAAFQVLAYEETAQWRYRAESTSDGLLAAVDEIAVQTGEDPDQLRAETREMRASVDDMSRRVLIVAERVGPG
jgi:ubiquinone/menaquinone biosynthesis C-methylase UbiE